MVENSPAVPGVLGDWCTVYGPVKVDAGFKDGVLTIKVAKKASAATSDRRIDLRTG